MFKSRQRKLIDFDIVDKASRGPLGCIELMWHTKGGTLLSIGALTVIAAIAFDPFTQQVVQYGSKSICHASSQARLPRAQRYSQGLEFDLQATDGIFSGFHQKHMWIYPDFSMQSAVLYGLSQLLEKVTQQLAFSCPSQNCSWTTSYDSLAVCSRCEDITGLLEQAPICNELPSLLALGNTGAYISHGTVFTLPNNLRIANDEHAKYIPANRTFTGESDVYLSLSITSFGTSNASLTNVMQDLDTLIWSMSMIRIKPDIKTSSILSWPDIPVEAVECALYYCVNRYTSRVTNGEVLEDVQEIKKTRRNASS